MIYNLYEHIADTYDNNKIVEKMKKTLCRLRNVYSDENYIIDSEKFRKLIYLF